MPFAVTTPAGHVVRLDDVPLSDLTRIAKECEVDTWAKFMTEPIRNGAAAEALYLLACERTNDTPPESITPRVVIEAFEWVDDDLPDTFEGGLPLAEEEAKTSGSSGAPSDSSGPQASLEL